MEDYESKLTFEEIINLNKLTEKKQINLINSGKNIIQYIRNPSKAVQLAAVEEYPFNIRYIDDPDPEVQLLAIDYNSETIKFIKNPTKDAIVEAVFDELENLKYVKVQTEELQLSILDLDINPMDFLYFKNPTKKVVKKFLKDYPAYYPIIPEEYKTKNIQKFVVDILPEVICLMKPSEQTDDLWNLALSKDGDFIRHIENPSEKLQLTAVSKSALAIRYIENPSKKVQLKSFLANQESIRYIKNPSKDLIRKVIITCYKKKDIIALLNIDFTLLPDDLKLLLEI